MNNSDNIQVFIRVRPLSAREAFEDPKSCLCLDQNSLTIDPRDNKTELRTFTFDWVTGESSTQQEIFEAIGQPLADKCLQGYNCCIFAYGQTGAGKTYTMQGRGLEFGMKDEIHRGLQPRIIDCIFAAVARDEAENPDVQYSVKCGYLEIYNEQIIDLFNPNQKALNMREDRKEGVYVENLTETNLRDSQDAFCLLQQGVRNRHVSSTNMNLESSRSHSLFIMTIQRKTPTKILTSKFNFVDLAGSERQKQTNTTGIHLKEAGNINKSLSVLGLVINNLVEAAEGKSRHIAYRESKLTFILRDSLGGNSKTCLIANVSPAISSIQETISTLKFAQRAKQIKNKASINEDLNGDLIELKKELERVKEELTYYKQLGLEKNPLSMVKEIEEKEQFSQKMKDTKSSLVGDAKSLDYEIMIQDIHALYSQKDMTMPHNLSENNIQRLKEYLIANFKQNHGDVMLQNENFELKKNNEELRKQIQFMVETQNIQQKTTKPEAEEKIGCQSQLEEEEIEIEESIDQLRMMLREQACLLKEKGESLLEAESQNQELEISKLKICERLALAENKNQELLKNLEELKAYKMVTKEKLVQVEYKNQNILTKLENLEATKLALDEKLVQITEKNHRLLEKLEGVEAIKLLAEKKSLQAEDKYLDVLRNLEMLKTAQKKEKEAMEQEMNILVEKLSLDNLRLNKEKEEISQQLEQKSQELTSFKSKPEPQQVDEIQKELDPPMKNFFKSQMRERENLREKTSITEELILEAISRKKRNEVVAHISPLIQNKGPAEKFVLKWFCRNLINAFQTIQEEHRHDPEYKEEFSNWRKLIVALWSELISTPSSIKGSENHRSSSGHKENITMEKIAHSSAKEEKIKRSTNVLKSINGKRYFDSVEDDSKKKDDVYLKRNVKQGEKDRWDFVHNDLPIIKKLKNH